MSVASELYDRVSDDTTVQGLVDDAQITAGTLRENYNPATDGPAIVLLRISTMERISCMGADSGVVRGRFQASCFASSVTDARGVVEAVRKCLQRYSGGSIQDIYIRNEIDLPDPDNKVHQIALDFEVVYNEDLS